MKLLIVFLVACVAICSALSWRPPEHDDKCGFTRQQALECAMKYADTNHDNRLDQTELENAKSVFVPWYLRVAAWIKGIDLTRILKDCDYDKDGVLTPHDWELSKKTCMPKQENLCKFKWFCDYAESKSKNV